MGQTDIKAIFQPVKPEPQGTPDPLKLLLLPVPPLKLPDLPIKGVIAGIEERLQDAVLAHVLSAWWMPLPFQLIVFYYYFCKEQ